MGRTERREKVALDQAYQFYKAALSEDANLDLHRLANSLKTVNTALAASEEGHLKITTRLWMRMRQALFDKLLTSFPAYLVVINKDGRAVEAGAELPDDGTLEIHPEGLRRDDDFFSMEIRQLHPSSKSRLTIIWTECRPITRREDFAAIECAYGVCTPKLFVVGDEVLQTEASVGKRDAHQQWWDLFWRAYCTPDRKEKLSLGKQMARLECIWGKPATAS